MKLPNVKNGVRKVMNRTLEIYETMTTDLTVESTRVSEGQQEECSAETYLKK